MTVTASIQPRGEDDDGGDSNDWETEAGDTENEVGEMTPAHFTSTMHAQAAATQHRPPAPNPVLSIIKHPESARPRVNSVITPSRTDNITVINPRAPAITKATGGKEKESQVKENEEGTSMAGASLKGVKTNVLDTKKDLHDWDCWVPGLRLKPELEEV